MTNVKKCDIIQSQNSKSGKITRKSKTKNEENSLIGKLDDVEIIFLHYHDKKILIEKWNRRVERINWDRLILKFSYQNECSDELIKSFLEISDFPKFCLVGKKNTDSPDEILFKRRNGKETVNETENFDWFINPIALINDRL